MFHHLSLAITGKLIYGQLDLQVKLTAGRRVEVNVQWKWDDRRCFSLFSTMFVCTFKGKMGTYSTFSIDWIPGFGGKHSIKHCVDFFLFFGMTQGSP